MIEPLLGLLHALVLVFQSLLVGGTVFALVNGRKHRLPALAALALFLTTGAALALQLHQLMDMLELDLADAVGADFVRARLMVMAAAALASALCLWRRAPNGLTAAAALVVVAVAVSGGHAASRLEGRALAMAADFLHQAAAGLWLGGIPFLLLGLRSRDGETRIRLCRRFSPLAMASVAVLVGSAAVLAVIHVGSWEGMVGTDFGTLLLLKAALLSGMLALGFGNWRAGPHVDREAPLRRLRSFAAAEIALGFAVLAVAGTLAALPPPAAVPDQVTPPAESSGRVPENPGNR